MRVGERAKVTVAPEYAYGKDGTDDGAIPGGSTLLFDIELLKSGGSIQVHQFRKLVLTSNIFVCFHVFLLPPTSLLMSATGNSPPFYLSTFRDAPPSLLCYASF